MGILNSYHPLAWKNQLRLEGDDHVFRQGGLLTFGKKGILVQFQSYAVADELDTVGFRAHEMVFISGFSGQFHSEIV